MIRIDSRMTEGGGIPVNQDGRTERLTANFGSLIHPSQALLSAKQP